MLPAMLPTKLQWAVKTARASFELDIDLCFCQHLDHISLPPFFAPEDDDLAWQITVKFQPERLPKLLPSGKSDGQWLSFILSFKSSSGKAKVPVQTSINISQSVDRKVVTELCNKHPGVLTEECFLSSSRFMLCNIDASGSLHMGSLYVCNKLSNKVLINVKLTVNSGTFSVENPPPIPLGQASKSQEISLRALGSSLDSLLQSGLMSDVTLSVEGHELRAHRSILAARSDVFKAMFASECRESASGIVKIEDIRLPVFKEFLRFVYSGSLSAPARTATGAAGGATQQAGDDGANAGARDRQQAMEEDDYLVGLLVAADKYLVEDLKAVCQGRLLDRLSSKVDSASVKTLCDVLRAGHHLGSAPLSQVGITYLRLHRAEVLASPEWKDFAATSRRVAADAMLDSMMPPEGEKL